ncbi:hypothetical protein [Fastidiosibacter lacustris]|uniref:hypothetical protein n=1 Tax=Fastidiosibacter lacustris TaxID=2056695 RepID=UPI000E350625|nr:hypothetical protein [Fastidiosibacter lacustris]
MKEKYTIDEQLKIFDQLIKLKTKMILCARKLDNLHHDIRLCDDMDNFQEIHMYNGIDVLAKKYDKKINIDRRFMEGRCYKKYINIDVGNKCIMKVFQLEKKDEEWWKLWM